METIDELKAKIAELLEHTAARDSLISAQQMMLDLYTGKRLPPTEPPKSDREWMEKVFMLKEIFPDDKPVAIDGKIPMGTFADRISKRKPCSECDTPAVRAGFCMRHFAIDDSDRGHREEEDE